MAGYQDREDEEQQGYRPGALASLYSRQDAYKPGALASLYGAAEPTTSAPGGSGGAWDSIVGAPEPAPSLGQKLYQGFEYVVDQLSRGTYASAKAADTLLTEFKDPSIAVHDLTYRQLRAAWAGIKEGFKPKERLTYERVIKNHAPKFAAQYPTETFILGLAGDIALAPDTWVTFGAGGGAKVAVKGGQVALKSRSATRELARMAGADVPQRFSRLRSLIGAGSDAPSKALVRETDIAVEQMYQAEKTRTIERFRRDMAHHMKPVVGSAEATGREKALSLKLFRAEREARLANARVKAHKLKPDMLPALDQELDNLRRIVEKMPTNGPAKRRLATLETQTHAIRRADRASAAEAALRRELEALKQAPVKSYPELVNDVATQYNKRLTELAEARDALRGKAFRSSEEIEEAAAKLLGYSPPVPAFRSLEERVADLLTDPKIHKRFVDQGGVKVFGKTVVSGRLASDVAEFVGLTRLKEAASSAWHATGLSRALNVKSLPEEYLGKRQSFLDAVDSVDTRLAINLEKIFGKKGSAESAARIGRTMLEARDLAVKHPGASEGELKALAAQHFRKALSPNELAVAASLQTEYARMGRLEVELGLVERLKTLYAPRYYDVLRKPGNLVTWRQGLRKSLPADQQAAHRELFKTMDQAVEAGFQPVTDAATMYALRFMEHERAVANKEFSEAVKSMFPGVKVKGTQLEFPTSYTAADREAVTAVFRDFAFVGEGLYSPEAAKSFNTALRAYDGMTSWWRKAATVLRPAFGVRQAISNPVQQFLVQGMGYFDPRVHFDTLRILTGHGRTVARVSPWGETLTGEKLLQEAVDHGILRGAAMDVAGPKGRPQFVREVQRQVDVARRLERWKGDGALRRGAVTLLDGMVHYMDFPGKVEDYGRLSGYINARLMGHSPAGARNLTDKALFDYLHGLARSEQRWIRRVVPFYSFNRFIVPLLADRMFHTPGRVASATKVAEGMVEAFGRWAGGETLTDAERNARPGWLMEQPHALVGFTPQAQAFFASFNNFTPLDILSVPWGDGASEEQGWAEKAILAQLTPMVKVPVELFVTGRDSFTGRPLREDSPKRRIGNVDPDELLRNWTTAITANASGNALLASMAGVVAEAMSPAHAQRILGALVGYEKGVDRQGNPTAYVNALRMHTMVSAMPGLQDGIKVGRDDYPPMARALQMLFGVSFTKVDLAEQRQFRLQEMEREIRDKERDVSRAELYQQHRAYWEALEDLQTLMATAQSEADSMAGPVRGQGMMQ